MPVKIIRRNEPQPTPRPQCDDTVFDGFTDAESVHVLLGWLREPPTPERHARARHLLTMYANVYDMMIGEREHAAQARDYLRYVLEQDTLNPPTKH